MTRRQVPRWSDLRPLIGMEAPSLRLNQGRLDRCASVADIRALARRRVPRAVFDYTDGAAGADESSLRRARAAFGRLEFQPRVLRDVSAVDTTATILGKRAGLPMFFSPTGFTRMMNHEGEPAVARVAEDLDVPFGLSTLGTTSPEELAEQVPGVRRWFQLYLMTDRGYGRELVDRAAESGYDTIILTVDTPVAGRRHRDVRNGLSIPPRLTVRTLMDMATHPNWWFNLLSTEPLRFATLSSTGGTVADLIARVFDPAITIDDLDWLRAQWPGNLIVKGIQTVDDAAMVARHGADAVILSTHGGRQLERAPVPLEILPRVREALDPRIEVYLDGGVMSGADVVAAVASGATAVGIGRAYLYGLMAGGEAGVRRVAELMRDEITTTMQLLGRTSVAELTPDCVRRRD